MTASSSRRKRSPLFILFTTVLVDLIGFGMVIPLVGLYGRHYGTTGLELSLLGAIYSLMSFLFSPFWGALSDRIGRRPVLLLSLVGSTGSYLLFAYAPNTEWLIFSRALGGIFAANITAAYAYIADVTTPQERARGMGLLGAAFGIGFTLGPPLGGIAAQKLGLAAPGLIAATICALNFLVATFRLPESLPPSARADGKHHSSRSLLPLNLPKLLASRHHSELWFLFLAFFFVTFAFSNMEQTFSLLFQTRFDFPTELAGYKTGLVLMVSGIVGAVVQGGLIRHLAARFGERKLMVSGLLLNGLSMWLFPRLPSYESYFIAAIPMALGSALINPSLSSLTSKSVGPQEQGATLGISQGLGALARAAGPFVGLMTFQISYFYPYAIATTISACLFILALWVFRGRFGAKTH